MQTTHQAALKMKHTGLDRKIAEEAHRPLPDPVVIADLKKRKLQIKEELEKL